VAALTGALHAVGTAGAERDGVVALAERVEWVFGYWRLRV